ncbi:hypothetical protein [Streptomyces atriruber]|uniref:hypothetical protein n=1 Tax=Streptomyces atriruber TaxID=545121 RepID=UPI0006E2873C|nr:hypothetical protein [Streptomyces atriruber]
MRPVLRDDVRQLAKRWVDQARTDALKNGEEPPPAFADVPDAQRAPLFHEAHYWHTLASGLFMEQSVPPRPSTANIRAMRSHLAESCALLHSMMDRRGDALPEGAREQLATLELRVAMALDLVENAGTAWARETDAAWHELMLLARLLTYDPARNSDEWVPEGWNNFAGLYLV